MISTLFIKNIGIIDEITINLDKGVNALTGETGAGKSLIINSLLILSGGRFSKDMIKKDKEYSVVEACIYFPESDLSEDGNIIVSREININGKNLCKINGRLVTVSELKEFMRDVIDIHSQNDNQILMCRTNHISLLDEFIGDNIKEIKSKYLSLFYEYNSLKKELEENFGTDIQRQRTLDLLKYQLNEIEEANLKLGEEEELESQLKVLQNSEKLVENLNIVDSKLNNEILTNMDVGIKALVKIENIDSNISEMLKRFNDVYYELQDICNSVNSYSNGIDFDDDTCNNLTKRLELIYNLKRKYGKDIQTILEYKGSVVDQIDKIENKEVYLKRQEYRLNSILNEMEEISNKLHKIRIENSLVLENRINKELKELEMFNASIKVKIEKVDEYGKNGLDSVEFFISTNKGEEYKPLVKIASGGELSRIMLALKIVFADIDSVPILVLDEVDTGISGVAAKSVSRKIKELSRKRQIICVTHLAVIAACADNNYFISKKVINNKTIVQISKLNEEESLREIARISSGDINSVSIQHAMILKEQSRIPA